MNVEIHFSMRGLLLGGRISHQNDLSPRQTLRICQPSSYDIDRHCFLLITCRTIDLRARLFEFGFILEHRRFKVAPKFLRIDRMR